MSLLVVGTVALDSVKTPFGNVENALGGSATYFSTSASYFTDVRMVAVIGEDFPKEHIQFLKSKSIDIRGLEVQKGETFRWKGEYGYDLNEAHTLATHLNVLATFKPNISDEYKNSDVVFLANVDPEIQLDVLKQVKKPKLVACDTMNYWISSKLDALKRTLKEVDLLTINEAELRQLAGEASLVKAAKIVQTMGPKTIVVKQGSYGAIMFSNKSVFSAAGLSPRNRVRSHRGRRYLRRWFHGILGEHHELFRRKPAQGRYLRQRHGVVERGGLQS